MFIQTETTPNPATLKFLPGRSVLGEGTASFTTADEADASPLAAALFQIGGVTGVMLGGDFLTVTKADGVEWAHIKPALLGAVMDHYVAGLPVMRAGFADAGAPALAAPTDVSYDDETQEIVDEICSLIDQRVRPAVAADGGDIVFHRFEKDTGRVFLTMHGSCSGCPSSTLTLKSGIENLLKHYVPEVTSVEAVV